MKRAAVGLTLAAAVSMTHWPVGFPAGNAALTLWLTAAAVALAMAWVVERATHRPLYRVLLGLALGTASSLVFLPLLPANSARAAFEAAIAMGLGVAIVSDDSPAVLRNPLTGLTLGVILTPAVVAVAMSDASQPLSSPVAGAAIVPMACAAIGLVNHLLEDLEFDIAFSGFIGLVAGVWLGWALGCAGLATLPFAGFALGLTLAYRRIVLEDPWNHTTERESGSRS